MPGNRGRQRRAERALRTLERRATGLGAQLARSIEDRLRRTTASRPVRDQRLLPRPTSGAAAHPAPDAALRPAAGTADVSEIEVRDLRAELADELGRLAAANIRASRGDGRVAGDTRRADGQR